MIIDVLMGLIIGNIFSPFDSDLLNYFFGVLATLSPDVDGLIYFSSKFFGFGKINKKVLDHREIMHYPLVFISGVAILLYIFYPKLIPLFACGAFLHFVHDSIGVGWGIPWLYPINKQYYKFLYQHDLASAGIKQRIYWNWSGEEQNKLIKKYGDSDWYKHSFTILKQNIFYKILIIIVLIYILILSASF